MKYITDDYDEYSGLKKAMSNCLKYRAGDYYFGLMDRYGNMITPSLFGSIKTIVPGLYHCEGDEGSIIHDDKGIECEKKMLRL